MWREISLFPKKSIFISLFPFSRFPISLSVLFFLSPQMDLTFHIYLFFLLTAMSNLTKQIMQENENRKMSSNIPPIPETAGGRYRAWVWPGKGLIYPNPDGTLSNNHYEIHPDHVAIADETRRNAPVVSPAREGEEYAVLHRSYNILDPRTGRKVVHKTYIKYVTPNGEVVPDPATWP